MFIFYEDRLSSVCENTEVRAVYSPDNAYLQEMKKDATIVHLEEEDSTITKTILEMTERRLLRRPKRGKVLGPGEEDWEEGKRIQDAESSESRVFSRESTTYCANGHNSNQVRKNIQKVTSKYGLPSKSLEVYLTLL
ncbi:hypothetical protein J6590_040464 [Homalodisca vitripennis]|nr:hypothetical protein J6590_040464 [Homalodisca vitripennis]